MSDSRCGSTHPTWHRLSAAVTAVLALVCVVPLSNIASATTSATTSTYLLYVGHGVGVAATANPNTGCSEVSLTTDFIHWRNITPPLKVPKTMPKGTCLCVWKNLDHATRWRHGEQRWRGDDQLRQLSRWVASAVRHWLQRQLRTPADPGRGNDVVDPFVQSSKLVPVH
jgi:hypothetical protein